MKHRLVTIKHFSPKFWVLFVSQLFIHLSLSAPVIAQQQPAGVVTGIQGQAQLTRPATASPLPLRFKDGVVIRDVVDTKEKSLARILFGSRSTVTVRELSRLEVREELLPTGARRDVHDLSSGAILVNVARQLMGPGDEVQIRTPNAIAAVRGSTLFASFNPLLNQSFFAQLSGTGVVNILGQSPVTLAAFTGVNISGTGPAAQVNQVKVTQSQVNQILSESQVGKAVKEEGNKNQVAQAAVKEAAALANAVVDAVTKSDQQAASTQTQQQTTPSENTNASTTAPVTPSTSTTDNPDVELSNTTKTLSASETLKTFSTSINRTGTTPVVKVTNNATVNQTGAGNLIQTTPGVDVSLNSSLLVASDSTITSGGNLLRLSSTLTGPGPILDLTNTTLNLTGAVARLSGGSTLTVTSGPAIRISGGSLTADALGIGDSTETYNFTGTLLDLTNTTVTLRILGEDVPDLNADNFHLTLAANEPMYRLNNSTLNVTGTTTKNESLISLSPAETGTTFAGLGMIATNSTVINKGGGVLEMEGTFNTTSTSPLLQITGSSVTTRDDLIEVEHPPGTATTTNITMAGPLVSDSGGTFTISSRFLNVSGGSSFTSTSTSPLIQFSGSTVNTKDDFILISGAGSKITLSGSLLSAGSTLNIGTEPALFGDLLDIHSGGQLVMKSSNPVVQFTGGTHTIGTADSTLNDTPNRIFNLTGVNIDSVTGLGTDQVIKGNGTDPVPFTGANNPIGVLLKATDAATIEVKKGSGDTAGGNAVRIDTALYEATAPILELIGSATKETTLTMGTATTTENNTIDIFKSKVASLGPVVSMDKSFINVTNGAFINLSGGSEWKVTGDLLKLFNGAKIEVINGPLIKVSGTSSTGTQSLLDISQALVNFGGTGNNKIIVNNSLCGTMCVVKSSIQVLEGSTGSITIGPNPIKNPSLGSILPSGLNTAVIQTGTTGKVNITAP